MQQDRLEWLFPDCLRELLPDVPLWVKKGIARRAQTGKIVLVSAVCPDYTHEKGGFTYATLSDGVPYLAEQHLGIVEKLWEILRSKGISLEYHITLADTEFDLPLVVARMSGGDADEFTRRCQKSCDALFAKASAMGLPVITSRRFLDAFPAWLEIYHAALEEVDWEIERDPSVVHDLINNSMGRESLYQAMTAARVDADYCRQIAKRQWAQYMAWGALAESSFGAGLVMMNHDTPNLGRVNHVFSRKGAERIPILRVNISTMPKSG